MNKKQIIDITLIPIFATIIFVQEQLLAFLPNIQLTIFLIVLYAKKIGFVKTSIIILIHVILDNLIGGSFNFMYLPFMFLGWMIIPIFTSLFLEKCDNPLILAILGFTFAFTYSWCFIIPNCLIMNVSFKDYLIADFPFELILAISSFLSILWLYNPCSRMLTQLLAKIKK